ncbi:hypothetical protein [Hankyongella ginsenosidimutans]|uniref:hypothetical protein n=1 Tax=Hankyongella ginsenosidimutans TaxID=1763828 RepID=UPI001CA30990|nr:hypothetical protein [Hankyongella ginsenosidimutans]
MMSALGADVGVGLPAEHVDDELVAADGRGVDGRAGAVLIERADVAVGGVGLVGVEGHAGVVAEQLEAVDVEERAERLGRNALVVTEDLQEVAVAADPTVEEVRAVDLAGLRGPDADFRAAEEKSEPSPGLK